VAREEVAGVGTAAPKLGVGAMILQGEEERGGEVDWHTMKKKMALGWQCTLSSGRR
jgi:hypothetical protein